jgi:flagellar FliL protein
MAKKEQFRQEESDNKDEAQPPASNGSKNVIIAVILLLFIIGGAAGAYFGGFIGKKASNPDEAKVEEHTSEGASKEADPHGGGSDKNGAAADQAKQGPIYFTFPENQKFIINLNTGGKQTSFLKVDVALELPDPKALDAVNANLPRIMDAFNTYLRELRPSDLQGSAGVYRLREELLLRVNKSIYPSKVNDVLFKEFVVQ